MKKDIPCRHYSKESWSCFINIKVGSRQKILPVIGLLQNEKGFNSPRRQKH